MADRGTVIKASGNRAFIMNEHCQFLEVKAAAGLQPGDHIEYLPRDIVRPGIRPARAVAVAASFIIVCLIAFTSFQHMLTGKVYAYIGMEINPSIEIGVNSESKVVRLKGYNEDGKRLIGSRDLLNSDINDALRAIIRDCREGNYLGEKKDNDIAVSVNIPGGANGRVLMQQVDTAAKTALAENGVSARIHYFSIDERIMEQAREQDVSPLKYMLWEEAGRLGYSIPLQSVSIGDPLIKEIASDREEKVGSGVTAGSEAPPSDGPAVAVPAEESRQGQEAGGQVGVPKEKGRQPDSGSDTGPKPKAKPAEAANNGADRSGKESGLTGGEVRLSSGASGENQKENKGPGGEPAGGAEGKSPQDKVLSQPAGKTVNPDGETTIAEENVISPTGEAAGAEKVETGSDKDAGSAKSSGSGGKSGGGGRGGGGGSGGKGK